MIQEKAKVLWNNQLSPGYYRIGLTCHQRYSHAKPGQFIMLRFPDRLVPFLRRPFSIHRLILTDGQATGVEILYKVVGEGTKKLSMCRAGEVVDILGPLGNSFSISNKYQHVFFVVGGIGVAPMPFLASSLLSQGVDPSECVVFIGGRSEEDLLCRDDFLNMGMTVQITTDDGSAGDQCLVTQPLETVLDRHRPDIIYACGPLEMLKCVVGIAEKLKVPCQVSIETMMACGMGACLGCAVEKPEASSNYLHTCIDGPVFDSRQLKI